MNYLIVDNMDVFVAKVAPDMIVSQIQSIESQKTILLGCYVNSQSFSIYYNLVLNMLDKCFSAGFAVIERYKNMLRDEIASGCNNFMAVWNVSNIVSQLKLSLHYAIPFDSLPTCNITLSAGRDALIKMFSQATNKSVIKIIGNVLSLAFKIVDLGNIGKMFWFYNTIIIRIGENPQYENERNLLRWAKAQRGYAYFALIPAVAGGAANVASIIDEVTAKREIEQYGQKPLELL